MYRIFLLISVLLVFGFAFACGGSGQPAAPGSGGDSPTEAYKRLYAAVKAKDMNAIKANLTKKSIEFGKMAAQRNNTEGDKIYENGFTGTTFADSLPEIRDQRVKENMGNVEVWNSKESRWEDLPFILEDGGWKLAVGDLFAGTFNSPGRGRDSLEKEAANAIAGNQVPVNTVNMNAIPVNKPTVIPGDEKAPAKK